MKFSPQIVQYMGQYRIRRHVTDNQDYTVYHQLFLLLVDKLFALICPLHRNNILVHNEFRNVCNINLIKQFKINEITEIFFKDYFS